MLRRLSRTAWPHALVVLAALAIVVFEARRGGWPRTHENLRYLVLAEHFKEAFLAGQFWPRWLPEINGGYGYPTFVFYQPLFFFLMLPFRLVTGDPIVAAWLAIACALLIGALASYKLCARTGSRELGLFGAGLFLLAPYLYVNLLVRGDLSELLAMCLVPLALHFLRVVIDRWDAGDPTARPLAGLAITISAVLLAHPITGILSCPSLAMITLLGALRHRRIDGGLLLRVGLAGLAALALATPYWQPLVSLRPLVNLDAAFVDYYNPVRHTVHWKQFFAGSWGFGGSVVDSPDDKMPFVLGPLLFAAALTGVVVGWSHRFVRGAGVAVLLSIAVMTPALSVVWRLPVFSQMQFPWRMLSVVVGLLVACSSGWATNPAFDSKMASGRRIRIAVLLALALFAAGWRPEQFKWRERLPSARADVARLWREAPSDKKPHAGRNEFLPRTVKRLPAPRGKGPMVEAPPGVEVHPRAGHGPYDIAVEVAVSGPVELVINQLYFPGWQVELNGQSLDSAELEKNLREDGRIRVKLAQSPARQLVEAHYSRPPGLVFRVAGVALGIMLLLFTGWLDRRRARTVRS